MTKLRRGQGGSKGTGDASGAQSVVFTIGTEAADVINVSAVVKDYDVRASVSEARVLTVFLSDDSGGIDIAATAPDGGIAAGTNGVILDAPVANKLLTVQTAIDGTFDIDITDSGTPTFYVVAVLPNGKQVVSEAVTFA